MGKATRENVVPVPKRNPLQDYEAEPGTRDRFDMRVITADGQDWKRFLWAKRTKNHMVSGSETFGDGDHFTYHFY